MPGHKNKNIARGPGSRKKPNASGKIRVTVARGSGLCFGVKRAISLAQRALEELPGPFYTLGELIHNPQVVRDLERKGLGVAAAISGIDKGTVVIRCHGVSPGIIEEAKKKKVRLVDATCPFVKKAQLLASFLSKAGYPVVVVGDRGHPEVEAIAGGSRKVKIVGTEEEALRLKKVKKLGVVAQTTQSFETLSKVVNALMTRAQELYVCNTTCETTSRRQAEARKLAEKVDVMVVVGGRNSANTARLFDICRKRVRRTHWVETADEVKSSWFRGAVHVGVTGGASTPDRVIREVADRITSTGASKRRAPSRVPRTQKNH